MTEVRQDGQKKERRSTNISAQLNQIDTFFIFEAKCMFYAATIAAVLTFLLFAGGLVAWLAGIAAQGWIASIFSPGTGLLSVLFFNREKAAHERVETVRISWEKEQEEERKKRDQELEDKRKKRERELAEERKKRDQELEDKRKKQKEEEYESYVMHKLEAYYKLASKTDDEVQRETYYHELFGPTEYNKRRIEAYFNTVSQMAGEDAKKVFFREMFGALLKSGETVLTTSSHLVQS